MTRLETLNHRQREAIDSLSQHSKGTLKAVTAFGKSFVMYGLLYKLLDQKKINLGDRVYFFSFTNEQSANLEAELAKYKEIKGKNPGSDFDLKYVLYQSFPDGDRKVDIYDEIDVAITAKYSRNIAESPASYRYGFSATNTENGTVFRDKVSDELHDRIRQSDKLTKERVVSDFINKGQLLEILCPVVFTYGIDQALEEGIISPFETYIVDHKLSSIPNKVKVWKTKNFFGSEYTYYDMRSKIMGERTVSNAQKKITGQEMARFLYNLPSKIEPMKNLVNQLGDGTVIFGIDLALLSMITRNVIYPKNPTRFTVKEGITFNKGKRWGSSQTRYEKTHMYKKITQRIQKSEYDEAKKIFLQRRPEYDLIEAFNEGKIQNIASSKAIGRGVTLKGAKNAVLVSYYSKSTQIIQWLGRILRYNEDKLAKLYIINTLGTFESEKWIHNINKVYDDEGFIDYEFDLNIKGRINSQNL